MMPSEHGCRNVTHEGDRRVPCWKIADNLGTLLMYLGCGRQGRSEADGGHGRTSELKSQRDWVHGQVGKID